MVQDFTSPLDPRFHPSLILGIETSCDETAVALVRGDGTILAHRVRAQIAAHEPYGGVVPEIAAREHISVLDHLISDVLAEAGVEPSDLTAIGATTGPGLIGGLIVGVMTGKAMATALRKPFIAVNHLEGHALTVRLTDGVAFPFLLLLVSGGHCQLLEVSDLGSYSRLGTTLDDAAGEAFDKTAKLLGLPYPGGPAVEQAALAGDPHRFDLPRPLYGKPGCDFSFSGLKTAVRRAAEDCVAREGYLNEADRADLCASFQRSLGDCIEDRTARAMALFKESAPDVTPPLFVVAGGVAANTVLRQRLVRLCEDHGFVFHAPPQPLCTDNGVMIAWAAMEHYARDPGRDDKTVVARPRWPLDPVSDARVGSGKKGAKA